MVSSSQNSPPGSSAAASPTIEESDGDLYLFGYGSLIWKQNFEFTAAIPSYITGFTRVFYQGSTDHRGVPEKPGRVVTLVPADPSSKVDGLTFRIPKEKKHDALIALDLRERGGYDRVVVPSYAVAPDGTEGDTVVEPNTLVYIANEENDEYLGAASPLKLAQQILACSGPSGPNRDYLFNLWDGLQKYNFHDAHIEAIVAEARKLMMDDQK